MFRYGRVPSQSTPTPALTYRNFGSHQTLLSCSAGTGHVTTSTDLPKLCIKIAGMNIHIHHFHSKGAMADGAALEQFQQQWATYQKLVDSDALAHQEVGTILHRALAAVAKPFAFLDIACGDAGQMRKALAGTKVRHYHGVDLSEPALELAAKNLTGVPFEVELDHRDFVTALTRRPEKADTAGAASRSIISRRTGSAISSRPSTDRPATS